MVIEREQPRESGDSITLAGTVARLLTDISVLPTVTSVRFAVLVLMLAASSGSIYAAIGLLLTPGLDINASRCTANLASNAGKLDVIVGRQTAANALICEIPYTGRIVAWSMSGIVLVSIATVIVYKLTPLRSIRWTRPWVPIQLGPGARLRLRRPWWIRGGKQSFAPLNEASGVQRMMLERIRELCAEAGLPQEPRCLLNPYARKINPRVFAFRREPYLLLPGQLWRLQQADPAVFDGMVLHELGHVRNHDNRATYMTYAAWRTFVVLALCPFLVALAISPRILTINSHLFVSIAALTLMLYATRAAVLRVRESHADVSAALVDERAIRAALEFAANKAPAARLSRPTFLSDHPSFTRRLLDLDGVSGLRRPDGWAMLAAGVAASLAVANLQWVVWFAVLSSSGLANGLLPGLIRSVMEGRAGPAFGFMMIMNGATMLLVAALFAGFACTTMWRARLAGVAVADQPDRPHVLRYAVPWAVGFVLGEPLSVIDAITGSWGVVDRSVATEAADYAASGLIITLLAVVSFRWAAESAVAWIPVAKGSLRRACARAAAVGAVGAWPVLLTWLLFHNGQFIRQVVTLKASPQIAHWPLLHEAFSEYVPLGLVVALPGAALCMALPALFVYAGLLRRPPDLWPNWLPADSADAVDVLRELRSRVRVTGLLKRGLLLATVSGALCFGAVIVARYALGGSTVTAGRELGAYRYLFELCLGINTLVVGATAAFVARRAHATALSSALITVLAGTTLAVPLAVAAVYVGGCGGRAWGCLTGTGSQRSYVYSEVAARAPVYAAIVALFLLTLGAIRAPRLPERAALEAGAGWERTRGYDTFAVAAIFIALSITTYAATHYVLTAHAALTNGISLLR